MNREQFEAVIRPTKRHRLVELLIDPASGQLSMSRLCLGLMNVAGIVAAIWCLADKNYPAAAGIVTGIAATDAGVYFGSTRKHFNGSNE